MMIPGIMAQRRVVPGSVAPASLVGIVGTSNTFSGTNFVLSVPAEAATGDTLIAILRCRLDRSFSVPAGWTIDINGATVGTSGTPTANTRIYVLSKPYAGETSLTFVQSPSAAGVATLVVVRGTMGGRTAIADFRAATRAPVDHNSMMLAIATANGTDSLSPGWSAAFSPGKAAHRWSASAPYYYGTGVATYSSGSTASVSVSYTWDPSVSGPNYIVLVEILPPA